MNMLWRGLCILPLLFVSGNCHLFPLLPHLKPLGVNGVNVAGGGNAQLVVGGSQGGGVFPVNGGSAAKGEDDASALETAKIEIGSDDKNKVQGNAKVNAETNYKGKWELFTENSGVSAMHVILFPKIDQVLMFDATVWKQSKIKLPGPPCRKVEGTNEEDCFCHSVLMDIETAKLRPLRLNYDTWCSSGALDVNGRLISTGGYNNGSDTVRILDIYPNSEWKEYPGALENGRWYATQVTLGDGRFMVFGGRNFPTYEFVPAEGQRNSKDQVFQFKFLAETHDPVENNLYPFVFLSTDGNLFIFANNRSILLNPNTQQVLHEFPVLPGGSRSYPSSGSACLLPIRLQPDENRKRIPAEVLICGGSTHDAFTLADLKRPKEFVKANNDCARLDITKWNGKWKIQTMPSPRLMGDAVVLPTGDVLLINGAMSGSAGWDDAREPNFTPVLYRVKGGKAGGSKFRELEPSQIPRMYHSSYALLPDSKILIAGSNTNPGYLDNALFPTEVRVEKFSPHYLDPALDKLRQEIVLDKSDNKINYGKRFTVQIRGDDVLDEQNLHVSIYYPAFTTHGISMNQRLVQLGTVQVVKNVAPKTHNIILQAPINGNIAPPGYYMLFVIYNGVPCKRAMWVQLLP